MSANDFMGSVRNNWRQRSTEKTTFKDELRIVPRWLVWLIVVPYVLGLVIGETINFSGIGSLIPQTLAFPELGAGLSGLALAGMITLVSVAGVAIILLYGYIYADAKRRGMSPVLWLIVSIFVPYLVGVVIYFIVREPLPFNCSQCGAPVTAQFNFCPRCQLNLRPNCPQCRREVGSEDRFCRHCGAAIDPGAATQRVPSGAAMPTV